jgi:hypothetical protein
MMLPPLGCLSLLYEYLFMYNWIGVYVCPLVDNADYLLAHDVLSTLNTTLDLHSWNRKKPRATFCTLTFLTELISLTGGRIFC